MYRTAFIDYGCAVARETFEGKYAARHGIVASPIGIQPAPGVETPVDAAPMARRIDENGGPGVAYPCVIVR